MVTKYFLIFERILVKGISSGGVFFLADKAFCYKKSNWVEMDRNEINDRLMGYDPAEDDMYSIGSDDIMDEIREISESEAEAYMKKLDSTEE